MLTSIRAALAGRYVMERELGRGSSATVYAARDLKHGRRVALKVIRGDIVNAVGTHRFLQEIRTIAILNHPHILPLFDSGEADSFIFYTMPLIEGASLRQRIEQSAPMAVDDTVLLVSQIASALAYAHSRGVVHRDVKPENILIGKENHVWIADFGLARARASATDHRLTGASMAVGTPQYMSPEQAAGETDIDARSDVYALGCITFELLCGAPPFTGGSVSSLLARHLSEPAPSIRDRRADVPSAIDTAIGRAMAKDRSLRFTGAAEFAAALTGPVQLAVSPEPLPYHAQDASVAARIGAYLRNLLDQLKSALHSPVGTTTAVARRDTADPPGPDPTSHWERPPLPVPGTPFVGREAELDELCELLTDPATRLVTVTGTGGVGKTRFALRGAERVATTFPDGVVFVPLSGLSSSSLLVPSIAEALGIQLSRHEDPVDELKAFLRSKQMLLVLDNFEHLTDAAGTLSTLLTDARGLRLLVTTRERLKLQHEILICLDGLNIGDDNDTGDAVELFLAGARRLDRHFQLDPTARVHVRRICELLNGIPLAIELAAGWVHALSCRDIVAELERDLDVLASEAPDVEQRHHSLRATFDASWRLLTDIEQSTLTRLAVFRSSFDRSDAVHVAEADATVLRQLVDKSLLTRVGNRLMMLDVVRAYALQRLADDTGAERRAHERHLSCLAGMLHSQERGARRAEPDATQRIADSIDDVRAAWNYACETHSSTAILAMTDGLFHFYEARGWAREGAQVFSRASSVFDSDDDEAPRPARLAAARLLIRHGVFVYRLGDLQKADSLLRRGVGLARRMDESAETAFGLYHLGAVLHGMGDYDDAEELHREAWSIADRTDDRPAAAWAMAYLGNVHWSRGEFDAAARLYTDALELMRSVHDLGGMWVTINNLGVIAASREHYEEAKRRFREGLELQPRLKNPRYSAHVLHNLGAAARQLDELASARESLEASLEISERMGYRSMADLTLVALAELAVREGDEDGAMHALVPVLRSAAASRSDPLALEALLTLAKLRLHQHDPSAAAELAAVVAHHPASDRDMQRRTADLLTETGSPPTQPDGDPEHLLHELIAHLVGTASNPTDRSTGTRRSVDYHPQPARET